MGGDHPKLDGYLYVLGVSIHAPAWGATVFYGVAVGNFQFQSTPPHGGRRIFNIVSLINVDVSIHAPAWGATFVFHFDTYT